MSESIGSRRLNSVPTLKRLKGEYKFVDLFQFQEMAAVNFLQDLTRLNMFISTVA